MRDNGPAFQRLTWHYENRLAEARAAHALGKPVVGRIGHTVPVELILAAGLTPVLVTADLARATPVADIYVDEVLPTETRALFEAGVAGDFAFLDLLVLSRPFDKLYYFLKEIYRLGRAPDLPPLSMCDIMQSQREAVRDYNRQQIAKLVAVLTRAGGKRLLEGDIRAAIALTNKVRGLQRTLQDLRWSGRLSGVEAMTVIGAGNFVHPSAYGDLLGDSIKDAGARPARPVGPRLLVATAEALQDLSLHQAIESTGAVVVAEDDAWGARAAGTDIDTNDEPLDAILDKVWRDTPTSGVFPPPAREAWLKATATRTDIDAVVIYMPPSDRLLGWDAPRLREAFAAMGKPTLFLLDDASTTAGREAIANAVQDFGNNAVANSRKEAGQ